MERLPGSTLSAMEPADLLDRTFGPHPFRICAGDVSDFVAVTGDDPARWSDVAPPGFVSAALFVVAPELLGRLGGRSVIHGEQTFTWSRPLESEEEVQVEGRVSRVRERAGIHYVGFDFLATGGAGTMAEGSSLFLVSDGGGPAAGGGGEEPEPGPYDGGSPREGWCSASRADLIRYAAATRDWNPVHWDHQAAVEAGLPGVVVHGLLQASWVLAEVCARSGPPLSAARFRFRNPLRPAVPARVDLTPAGNGYQAALTGAVEYLSAKIEVGRQVTT